MPPSPHPIPTETLVFFYLPTCLGLHRPLANLGIVRPVLFALGHLADAG